MRPPIILPHGTRLRSIVGGFRIDRPDRTTCCRVFVRLSRDRSHWLAFCDGWDGYTWNRDRVIRHPSIDQLEAAVREYAAGIDNHLRACSLPE